MSVGGSGENTIAHLVVELRLGNVRLVEVEIEAEVEIAVDELTLEWILSLHDERHEYQ